MKAEEGNGTFFKGLKPLSMRQIPYTMMKFACFEKTVVALYEYVVPKPRDQCSKVTIFLYLATIRLSGYLL